jgi:hypothetical protein
MRKTPLLGKQNINVSTNLRKVSRKRKVISRMGMSCVIKMMCIAEESAYEV